MPVIQLTSSLVKSVKCPPLRKKIDLFDAGSRGLMLEVRITGGKTYYQRYSDERGKERQFKLGPADVITLAQARTLGRRVIAESILGADPHSGRKMRRTVPTVEAFIQDQYLPFIKSYKRSWRTDETVLRLHILPVIGRLCLDEVTAGCIQTIATRMKQKSYATGTLGRAIIITRYIFNLARKWKIPGAGDNPAAGYPIAPDVQRSRYLSEGEIRKLLASLAVDENKVAANAITLLLTGGRRNEITHARWQDIDTEKGTLLVPIAKSGKPRIILLNRAALDLLAAIPRNDNGFIFANPTGRPSASLHFPWMRIKKRAGLSDVRIHDLRHSFASILVNEGVPLYEIQHLLGHANAKTTQRYAHLTPATLVQAAQVMSKVFERTKDDAT